MYEYLLAISGCIVAILTTFISFPYPKAAREKYSILRFPDGRKHIFFGVIVIFILLGLLFKYLDDKDSFDKAKPEVSVEGNYYDMNKFAIIIRTREKGQKEIIESLNIEYIVNGLVTNAYPRKGILNSDKPTIEIRSALEFNNHVILHKIIVKMTDVLPGALNGVVVEYQQAQEKIDFDERIKAEIFWKFKGQTRKEILFFNRKPLQP